LVLEMSPEREAPIRELLKAGGTWNDVSVRNDLAGRPRVVTARRFTEPR